MSNPNEIIKKYDEMMNAECVDDYEEKERELLSEAIDALREYVKTEKEQAPMTEEEIMKPVDFKDGCFGMRGDIELLKSKVLNWMIHPVFDFVLSEQGPPMTEPRSVFTNHSEMKANLILAYRHLEDARMRIGKSIQAYDGGKSCYPK